MTAAELDAITAQAAADTARYVAARERKEGARIFLQAITKVQAGKGQTMTAKSMAEVLAEHSKVSMGMTSGSPDTCKCGERIYPGQGDIDINERRDASFAAHQAAALSAAGFGLVADAKAEALLTMADRLEKARDMTWNGSMRKVNGWASAADFIRQHAEQADP